MNFACEEKMAQTMDTTEAMLIEVEKNPIRFNKADKDYKDTKKETYGRHGGTLQVHFFSVKFHALTHASFPFSSSVLHTNTVLLSPPCLTP